MAKVVPFKATVVDNNDPLGIGRARLRIPSMLGDRISDWAKPYRGPPPRPTPAGMVASVDDMLLVVFENGNTAYPMAFPYKRDMTLVPGMLVLPGRVLDDADPMAAGRVHISVPAISDSPLGWAPLCAYLGLGGLRSVAVGAGVVAAFESGDPSYPIVLGTLP